MSETLESRKICDLKVPELRSELEKRDLDKTGVKAILLERLQNALLNEGEDPENYLFDKFELITEKNTKSPCIEKKLSPAMEKKENKTISTTDKKPLTPTKTVRTNVVGRRPGPKSKTCVPQLKADKSNISKKKNDEMKQEQADSSIEETKELSFDISNSDATDSNEAETKETDANEVKLNESDNVDIIQCNENKMSDDGTNTTTSNIESAKESEKSNRVVISMDTEYTDNLKVESKETNQIQNLDNLNTNKEVSIKEEFSKTNEDLKEKNTDKTINDNNSIEIKEAIDEVNIHDEELDHEVDEEEIKASSDDFNQIDDTDKSIQENNKDDNNEDSINLTIGEDDIKLFADEEDTNIEKEDEVIENCTKEDTSLIKQRETRHPVTASSGRATTGSVKSRRSTTEKRSSVGDKPRSSHKEDKDNSNTKPIISVSVPKEEKKEEEKQIKDKMDAGIKQSTDSKTPQISNDTSKKNNASSVRNIWVSGLSSITKATDLKQLFSKYGKVVGAKVVTNAKTPGARCYGFVTLSSAEDANRSIENLHKTELHGRVISVERAKRDNGYQQTTKSSDVSKASENLEAERKNKKPEEKKDKREEKREKRPEITINDDKKPDISRDQKRSLSKDHSQSQETKRSKIVIEKDDRRKDRSVKSKSNERDRDRLRELQRERERLEREKRRQQEILNFTKMKAERERQKQKEQERAMRDEERKRRIEKERQLEIERKQKEEALRLEKERQKLRIERERIEKEKAELLRLERENQRLERERLQREKEELRRAQEKLEETKRQAALKRSIPSSPPPSKRHSSSSSRYDERKEPVRSSRVQPNTDYISQAAPPPPNITSSRHRYEQHSSDSRRSRPSPPPPPPPASRPKDSTVSMRYGAPPATDHHYRSREERSDRREESRRKETSSSSSSRHAHTSYDSNKSSYGISRNSESTWSSAPVKSSYSSLSSNSGSSNMVMNTRPDPWSNSSSSREIETNVWQRPPQPPTDKWNSTSSNPSSMSISGGRSSSSNTLYVNNHQVIPNMGLNMSTNYSDNRFDSYKMSGMSRKY